MDRIAYFYIIHNKVTNMSYAGSRRARGCAPSELLKPDGYHTSSKIIRSICESGNADDFDIVFIKSDFNAPIDALYYETRFLQELDCAGSPHWYNCHNNDRLFPYNSPGFLNMMKTIHGVEHWSQSKEWRTQMIEINQSKYGVDWYFQSKEFISAVVEHNLQKYNTRFFTETKEFLDKRVKTWIETLGVSNPSMSAEIKRKKRETYRKNWGVDHYSKTNLFVSSCRETYFNRTGYEWGKDPEQIKKRDETIRKNHGGLYHTQTDEFREQASIKMKEFWSNSENKENLSKKLSDSWTPERKKILSEQSRARLASLPQVECPYCGKLGRGPSMNRFHFDKCKLKGS